MLPSEILERTSLIAQLTFEAESTVGRGETIREEDTGTQVVENVVGTMDSMDTSSLNLPLPCYSQFLDPTPFFPYSLIS